MSVGMVMVHPGLGVCEETPAASGHTGAGPGLCCAV